MEKSGYQISKTSYFASKENFSTSDIHIIHFPLPQASLSTILHLKFLIRIGRLLKYHLVRINRITIIQAGKQL